MKDLWEGMYQCFKTVYPNLSKKAIGYHPHNLSSIVVWFEDGTKMLYNDKNKQGKWIKDS